MYGVINLVRHYPARYVEKAAELAKANGVKTSKALRRMVENMVKETVWTFLLNSSSLNPVAAVGYFDPSTGGVL